MIEALNGWFFIPSISCMELVKECLNVFFRAIMLIKSHQGSLMLYVSMKFIPVYFQCGFHMASFLFWGFFIGAEKIFDSVISGS